MNKRIGDCVVGGAAGLAVGVAVAALTTSKKASAMSLKKNMNKMLKGAGGVIGSVKSMLG